MSTFKISVFCLWSNRLRIILNGDATSMLNVRRYYTSTTDGLFFGLLCYCSTLSPRLRRPRNG